MKNLSLRQWIFMALCCDLGLFSKRLIAPFANILTDALHIPGGIGTAFSLLFLVVAAGLLRFFGCATLMAAVQSALALAFGMVGSMGLLSPVGYIVPGVVIDLVLWLGRRAGVDDTLSLAFANMLASLAACLTANVIVFHLHGLVLLLYASVALLSGSVCGLIAGMLTERLRPVFSKA